MIAQERIEAFGHDPVPFEEEAFACAAGLPAGELVKSLQIAFFVTSSQMHKLPAEGGEIPGDCRQRAHLWLDGQTLQQFELFGEGLDPYKLFSRFPGIVP